MDADIFADERIIISFDSPQGSEFRGLKITRQVDAYEAHKILKILLKYEQRKKRGKKKADSAIHSTA